MIHLGTPETAGWKKFRKVVDASTQARVAKDLGISQQTVSAYYRCRARPTGVVRDRCAAIYGIAGADWYTAEERRNARGEPRRNAS